MVEVWCELLSLEGSLCLPNLPAIPKLHNMAATDMRSRQAECVDIVEGLSLLQILRFLFPGLMWFGFGFGLRGSTVSYNEAESTLLYLAILLEGNDDNRIGWRCISMVIFLVFMMPFTN